MFISLSGKGTCAKMHCDNKKCPDVGALKGGKCDNRNGCEYSNAKTLVG